MRALSAILDYLDQFAPPQLAANWDNVGLLLGDRTASVQRIMTCLTVTPESAAEAIEADAQLIVSHHPILFRPVKRLNSDAREGQMLLGLIRASIAVYSPHTAFDNTRGGINEILARRLGLADLRPLRMNDGPRQCKIVVFVPENDLAKVSDALFVAGAGHIGEYGECSFRLAGTGTFFGSDAANPTVGHKGRREEVSELRLEVICPEATVEAAVAAMRRAHSYEEPAYDVYPLRPTASRFGEGRLGMLSNPTPLADFARSVKRLLNAGLVQVVGNEKQTAEKVAIVCGAGGELLGDAIRSKADVFLTGELRFHDYLAAQAAGLALVLPGHFATERCGVEELAGELQKQFSDVVVWASQREVDPVSSLTD
jgi:dinuclear metal center YbgI/SA1388 family protein